MRAALASLSVVYRFLIAATKPAVVFTNVAGFPTNRLPSSAQWPPMYGIYTARISLLILRSQRCTLTHLEELPRREKPRRVVRDEVAVNDGKELAVARLLVHGRGDGGQRGGAQAGELGGGSRIGRGRAAGGCGCVGVAELWW